MKRWGTITMVVFAFVVGFASTYNCGGGSSSSAQTSGYVSVPLMPSWNFEYPEEWYGEVQRVYCYWEGPPEKHYNMNGAYADTSVTWSGWMSAETDTTARSRFFTPVQLPDGATITSFGIWVYDNDATYDGQVTVRRSGPIPWGTGAATVPSPLYTSGSDNVPRFFAADAINPLTALVDNSQGSYYLDVELRGGTDVVMLAAVFGYEYQ